MASKRPLLLKYVVGLSLVLLLNNQSVHADPYRLRAGDLIEVWVAQQQSLSRQVVIRPDGRISLPLAGHLQAEGLTPEELEAALIERLRGFFKEDLNLTVMLGTNTGQEPPMIYVAGDVDQPGSYRFRPGMTVLHAISVAGGFFRPDTDTADSIDARRDLESAQRQLSYLLVREARLQAELNDQETIQIPKDAGAASDPMASGSLPQEQALMEMRRKRYIGQVEATELLKNIAGKEVSAVQEQIKNTDNQIELTTKRYESIRSLASKGIVTDSRLLDIEISLEELKRTRSQLQADLTRAQSGVVRNDSALPDIQNQRSIELQSEIQQTQREIDDARARVESSRTALMAATGVPVATTTQSEGDTRHYTLLRASSGGIEQIPVTELTPIQAGDLVKVEPISGAIPAAGSRPRARQRERN